MSAPQLPDPQAYGLRRFGEMLWERVALPGEAPGQFELFREGLVADLQPMTPYEAVLADHLIQIEWELREHRRMRDARLRSATLDAVEEAVGQALPPPAATASGGRAGTARVTAENAPRLRADLASGDPARLAEADRQLAALGLCRVTLMAMVWQRLAEPLARHEEMIRDLEKRRREVTRDLEALQRKRPIDQAVPR